MAIDRRRFLSLARDNAEKITIATATFGFGAAKLYQWNAERTLRQELAAQTIPVLTKKSHNELNDIPKDGEFEIKKFFQGIVFRIPAIVQVVCSEEFVNQLAAVRSDDAKQSFLFETFARCVLSADEINSRVQDAALVLGDKLDHNWANCCVSIAESWNVTLRPHSDSIGAGTLKKELEPIIRSRLQRAMELAFGGDQMPYLRSTEETLGKSAILLLELTRVTERLYLPTFYLRALQSQLDEVQKYLHDRKVHYKNQISRVFVDLSNDVGRAFHDALLVRVSELHAWQQEALFSAVDKHAADATAWFA